MANVNNPRGADLIETFNSAKFDLKVNVYVTAIGDTTPLYIGDPVKTTGTSDANGRPVCTKADAGDSLRGFVSSIEPRHVDENDVYRKASSVRTVHVVDDPYLMIEMQVNGVLAITDIGKYANLVNNGGNTVTGLSGTLVDLTSTSTDSRQLRIVSLVERIGNSVGQYSKVRCAIHDHELAHGVTGSQENIWKRTVTTIEQFNAGDDVDLGSGDLTANQLNSDTDMKLGLGTSDTVLNIIFDGLSNDGNIAYDPSTDNFDLTCSLSLNGGQVINTFSTDVTMGGTTPLDTILVSQKAAKAYTDSVAQGLHWQTAIKDQVDFTTAEPAAPSTGDRYINTVSGTSSVTTQSVTATYIYEWSGSTWIETVPKEGYALWDEAADLVYVFSNAGVWIPLGGTQSFLHLKDTPSAYTTPHALYKVNTGGDGVVESAATVDGSGNLLTTGDIGATGTRITKGWYADLEVTNPPTISGANLNASHVEMSLLGSPTYTTTQDFINLSQGASLWDGFAITAGGSGTVDVGVGTGLIKTTNSGIGANVSFDYAGTSALALTDNNTNYVYIDYNSGTPIAAANVSIAALNLRTQIVVGRVYREGSTVHILQAGQYFEEYQTKDCLKSFEVDGFQRASGEIMGEIATRYISVTAGVDYCAHNRFTTAAIDTSGADHFDVWNSAASTSADATGVSQVENANYWNGAAVVALTTNRYATRFFYRDHDGHIHMQYGTSNAVSVASALAEDVPIPPQFLTSFALYIGRIVIRQGAATFSAITNPFEKSEQGSSVTVHGDLALLSNDDHAQYLFLAGRAGGQIVTGGTGAVEYLDLHSTSSGSTGAVRINDGSNFLISDITAGVGGGVSTFELSKNGSAEMVFVAADDVTTSSTGFHFKRARGTLSALTNVVDGNTLMEYYVSGRVTGAFNIAGQVTFAVDGTPGAVQVPASYEVLLNNGTSLTSAFKISSALAPTFPGLSLADGIVQADVSGNLSVSTALPSSTTSSNGVLALATGEVTQLANIGATTISAGQWAELGSDAYALLAGRSGGQTLIGGTGSGDDLTLSSTSHGTKGVVRISDGSNFLLSDITNGTLGGAVPFEFSKNDDSKMIVITASDTTGDSPGFETRRFRGTLGSPTAVVSGNDLRLDTISAQGSGGLVQCGQMKFEADGTVGAQVPTSFELKLNNGTSSTRAFKINPDLQPAFPYLNTANGIITSDGSGFLTSSITLPNNTAATTQTPGDNTTKLATTAFVTAAVASADGWDEVMHIDNTFTVLDTENLSATITQNDTTNNPAALIIANTGSGNDITLPNSSYIKNGALVLGSTLEVGGASTLKGDVTIGNGGDVDHKITFNANTSSGIVQWLEDESELSVYRSDGAGTSTIRVLGNGANAGQFLGQYGTDTNSTFTLSQAATTTNFNFGSSTTLFSINGTTKIASGTFALATGTTVNEISTVISASSTDDQIVSAESVYEFSQTVIVITKSANDVAELVDAGAVIEYTNGVSDYTYTLPQNSDVAFPVGSWIEIRKTGAGEITITKGAGTTFRGSLGDVSVKIDGGDGISAFAEKTATNTWLISGSVKGV